MSFLDSTTFFYGYCAVVGPVCLAIGIYANLTARAARHRNK